MMLYKDGFLCIWIDEENNRAGCSDIACSCIEMSIEVAKYIAKKCKNNWIDGYKLLDIVSYIENKKLEKRKIVCKMQEIL